MRLYDEFDIYKLQNFDTIDDRGRPFSQTICPPLKAEASTIKLI